VEFRFIKVSYKGHVALLTLSCPSRHNCVTADSARELKEACQQIEHDKRIRAVVITGAGKVFSSGREAYNPPSESATSEDVEGWLDSLRCASALASLPQPSIAAINGDAVDHGLELALACDLRVAARTARLGFTDLARGAIPWDGGSQRLVRLVGKARTLELLLTQRLIDADEALAVGLVNKVEDDGKGALKSATSLASQIAEAAPIAARYTKEAVYMGKDMTLQQGLRLEADLSFLLQTTEDRKQGVESFLSKRKPRFVGR